MVTLYRAVGNPSNAVILSQNGTNATVRFTASSCIGNEQFRFRVCDRESGASERLCSTDAYVVVTINNVRPWVSTTQAMGSYPTTKTSRGFSFVMPAQIIRPLRRCAP